MKMITNLTRSGLQCRGTEAVKVFNHLFFDFNILDFDNRGPDKTMYLLLGKPQLGKTGPSSVLLIN